MYLSRNRFTRPLSNGFSSPIYASKTQPEVYGNWERLESVRHRDLLNDVCLQAADETSNTWLPNYGFVC